MGDLEAGEFKHEEMKRNLSREYFCRRKKLLQSKSSGDNVVAAINTWAVSSLSYSAALLYWTREELSGLDRRTRKMRSKEFKEKELQGQFFRQTENVACDSY